MALVWLRHVPECKFGQRFQNLVLLVLAPVFPEMCRVVEFKASRTTSVSQQRSQNHVSVASWRVVSLFLVRPLAAHDSSLDPVVQNALRQPIAFREALVHSGCRYNGIRLFVRHSILYLHFQDCQ